VAAAWAAFVANFVFIFGATSNSSCILVTSAAVNADLRMAYPFVVIVVLARTAMAAIYFKGA
jgi:hypothetical protein